MKTNSKSQRLKAKGQTCPHCGCSGQLPDSLKCDDCGYDLPAAIQHTAGPCTMCGAVHTPGALDAANVILNGKIKIETAFGSKTVCGVANLIDNETAAPELLAALESAVGCIGASLDEVPSDTREAMEADSARYLKIIAKAKG